jgi:branched-chain amino acid transport system ATP-binding protein
MTGITKDSSPPILELLNIHMQFGGIAALKGLAYQVPPGIIQAVIGPNGAGKTTLFHCISGIHQPTSGRILFQGQQISGQASHRVAAAGISRTFQHVALFKTMTVLENIMVGRHCRTHSGFWATGLRLPGMRGEEAQIREKAMAHLEFVGLGEAAHLPAGALPLGKQKILEIARALATDPRLVLLDEPAGGLNMRETEELGELIQRICRSGVTVMLVEHDMNLVMEISDLVLVLHFGEFLAAGAPHEIKDRSEVIEAYLGTGNG